MAKDILDRIYKWLVTICIVLSVIITIFLFGHGTLLLYEYVFKRPDSDKRWKELHEKFEHKKSVNEPKTYIIQPSFLLTFRRLS